MQVKSMELQFGYGTPGIGCLCVRVFLYDDLYIFVYAPQVIHLPIQGRISFQLTEVDVGRFSRRIS